MAEDNTDFEQIWAEAFSLYQEKTKRQAFPQFLDIPSYLQFQVNIIKVACVGSC